MQERETGSDVCVRVVRQEDGTQIHQQREEGKETQAEDDGRNRGRPTQLLLAASWLRLDGGGWLEVLLCQIMI